MKHSYSCAILMFALLLASSTVSAQMIWTDLSTDENLPDGVNLLLGVDESADLRVQLLEVDLNNPDIIVHPYFSQNYRTTTNFTQYVGAIAAINGGFFSSTASVSALVEPKEIKAQNLSAVNRDGQLYYVTRPFFAIKDDGSLSIDWVYHFGSRLEDMLWFNEPNPNIIGTPAPIPQRQGGNEYEQLLMGIGGGPMLVQNGEVRYTYDEEGFFGGSGLDGNQRRARTAVGFTDDRKVLMVTIDRNVVNPTRSMGITLPALAQLLIDLGAVEAMNLDGGGSTTMAIGNKLINRPNGGMTQRAVPTILAVTHADSLRLPPEPLQEVIIDTEDDGVTIVGNDWFQTANFGDSYGGADSPSWLAPPGDGNQFVEYKPELLNARYEVFGWWSASANRTDNTPYTIFHDDGETTVRVNQKINNAQWNSLGSFVFTGTETDRVVISNDASNGDFVVADAIRFVQLEPALVSTERPQEMPSGVRLNQNFPNPFNPTTTISFELPSSGQVSLKVYDLTGRLLQTIQDGVLQSGSHRIQFNAANLSSGTYMYVLETDNTRDVRLMTLIK